jgi:hypothetical protein
MTVWEALHKERLCPAIVKVKVKLSMCLTKHHVMKMCPVLN